MIDKEFLRHDNAVIADIEKDFRSISAIIKRRGRDILTDYSITPPQFVALQWLSDGGDMTIGELSSKMFLACSTTTDLIDRMEKKELVVRVKDPKDRRVVRIHLLDKAKKIIDEVICKRQAYLHSVLNDFSADELETLQKYLAKLHKNMK